MLLVFRLCKYSYNYIKLATVKLGAVAMRCLSLWHRERLGKDAVTTFRFFRLLKRPTWRKRSSSSETQFSNFCWYSFALVYCGYRVDPMLI